MKNLKSKILSLALIICLSISLLSITACDLESFIKSVKYDNAEKYLVGNCQFDYTEFDTVNIFWVLGDINVKQTTNTYIKISENVPAEAEDDYKMHYLLEDRVLRIQFWKSEYEGNANHNEKALTIELPATLNGELMINGVSSDVYLKDSVKVDTCKVETISGGIKIDNIDCNKLSLGSISGEIKVDKVTTKEASVMNTSGNIILNMYRLLELTVATVSGNVTLTVGKNGANIKFETVSGNLDMGQESGVFGDGMTKVSVETVSGNLTVKD